MVLVHTVGQLLHIENKGVTSMTNASTGNRLHDFPVSHPKECILMAFALEAGRHAAQPFGLDRLPATTQHASKAQQTGAHQQPRSGLRNWSGGRTHL